MYFLIRYCFAAQRVEANIVNGAFVAHGLLVQGLLQASTVYGVVNSGRGRHPGAVCHSSVLQQHSLLAEHTSQLDLLIHNNHSTQQVEPNIVRGTNVAALSLFNRIKPARRVNVDVPRVFACTVCERCSLFGDRLATQAAHSSVRTAASASSASLSPVPILILLFLALVLPLLLFFLLFSLSSSGVTRSARP
ncbi:MAG TPA: hypothetical protein VGU46_00380, partial [Acidobacteriaceae bacterium]|nr:hypothetical protein [Acidobacteriaceae bacterium]